MVPLFFSIKVFRFHIRLRLTVSWSFLLEIIKWSNSVALDQEIRLFGVKGLWNHNIIILNSAQLKVYLILKKIYRIVVIRHFLKQNCPNMDSEGENGQCAYYAKFTHFPISKRLCSIMRAIYKLNPDDKM